MPVTHPDCVRTHPTPQPFRTALLADWTEALFIHYAVDPAFLRPLLPAGLELDLHEGRAFVSLVAFTQRRLRPRLGGRIAAALSRPLAEHHFLNLRTYVRLGEEQGIYFLAEWIPNRLACLLGPALYGLPYHLGKLTYHRADGIFSACVEAGGKRLQFDATIDTARQPRSAESHTLDEFLVERYTAFTNREDQLYRFCIAHAPWKLTAASVNVRCDTLVNAASSPSPGTPGEGWGRGKFASNTAPSLTLPRSTGRGDKNVRTFAQAHASGTAPLLGEPIAAHYSQGLRDVLISPPQKAIASPVESTPVARGRVVLAGGNGFLAAISHQPSKFGRTAGIFSRRDDATWHDGFQSQQVTSIWSSRGPSWDDLRLFGDVVFGRAQRQRGPSRSPGFFATVSRQHCIGVAD